MRTVQKGGLAMARYSEEALFKAHDKMGLAKFGKRRWDRANIGWASGDRFISSKVYALKAGQKIVILTTEWCKGNKQPMHVFSDYQQLWRAYDQT
jgi:hypothetical protein